MGIVIYEQNIAFFASLCLGFLLGILYEVLRIVRTAVSHNALWIGIEDFFFAITCAFSVILLCYAYTSGQVRWFILAGIFFGGLCYFLSLGRLITRITPALLTLLRTIVKTLYRFTLQPISAFVAQLFRKLRSVHAKRTDQSIRRKLRTKP